MISNIITSLAAFAAAPVFVTQMFHANEAVGFILTVLGAR